MAVFAKYDGIDGESKDANHDKWIDVLSFSWGCHKPGGGATGQSRRRGAAIVEDLNLVFEYEKACPKLQKKLLMGEVIPKLELEQTATYGGARATYVKWEMENVSLTAIQLSGDGNDEAGPPICQTSCNFEKIKQTYTEYDDAGNNKGNVEYEHEVEKGA